MPKSTSSNIFELSSALANLGMADGFSSTTNTSVHNSCATDPLKNHHILQKEDALRQHKQRAHAFGIERVFLPIKTSALGDPDASLEDIEADRTCSICQNVYWDDNARATEEDPSHRAVQLPCGHVFGNMCIKSWMIPVIKSCPICRQKCDDGTLHDGRKLTDNVLNDPVCASLFLQVSDQVIQECHDHYAVNDFPLCLFARQPSKPSPLAIAVLNMVRFKLALLRAEVPKKSLMWLTTEYSHELLYGMFKLIDSLDSDWLEHDSSSTAPRQVQMRIPEHFRDLRSFNHRKDWLHDVLMRYIIRAIKDLARDDAHRARGKMRHLQVNCLVTRFSTLNIGFTTELSQPEPSPQADTMSPTTEDAKRMDANQSLYNDISSTVKSLVDLMTQECQYNSRSSAPFFWNAEDNFLDKLETHLQSSFKDFVQPALDRNTIGWTKENGLARIIEAVDGPWAKLDDSEFEDLLVSNFVRLNRIHDGPEMTAYRARQDIEEFVQEGLVKDWEKQQERIQRIQNRHRKRSTLWHDKDCMRSY